MNKGLELLKTLPSPFRELALLRHEQRSKEWADVCDFIFFNSKHLSHAIDQSHNWGETKEGLEFWDRIYLDILDEKTNFATDPEMIRIANEQLGIKPKRSKEEIISEIEKLFNELKEIEK